MSQYRTLEGNTITVYGIEVTTFEAPADRHVKVGRDITGGRCSMTGCRNRAHVYVSREHTVDVNAGRSRYDRFGGELPSFPAAGMKTTKLWACGLHFVEILDHAYLIPNMHERKYELRRRARRERTVCVDVETARNRRHRANQAALDLAAARDLDVDKLAERFGYEVLAYRDGGPFWQVRVYPAGGSMYDGDRRRDVHERDIPLTVARMLLERVRGDVSAEFAGRLTLRSTLSLLEDAEKVLETVGA